MDTTTSKYANWCGYLLQLWNMKCNDRNESGKIKGFMNKTRTISPRHNARATSLLPIGDSFMYTETNGNFYGQNFLSALRESMSSKLIKKLLSLFGFLQEIANQLGNLEYIYCC